MSRWVGRRVGIVAGVSAPLLVIGMVGATAAIGATSSSRARIAGTRPSWAQSGRAVGRAAGTDAVGLRVWLSFRQADAVRSLAASVTDPRSANFGHYLTPAQFNATYAPTAADATAVANWLRSAGLRVTSVPDSHRYVQATGSVSKVEKTLAVTLDNYSVSGHVLRAPANDPSVPAKLGSTVLGITGLDTGDHSMHPASQPEPPPAGFLNAPPLSTNYGDTPAAFQQDGTTPLPAFNGKTLPYAVRGYTPPDYRSAYGVTGSGLTGAGTTIAITDAYYASTIVEDANDYTAAHDPSAPALVRGKNYVETLPSSFDLQHACSADGWLGEETLDVEAAHGIAPGATIKYFAAADCNDDAFIDALSAAVQDPSVDVVSNSWDGYESQTTGATASAYEQVFQQGIVEGKSFLFSSGDDGDEVAATGTKQVDYPASDPYVTAAGGTSVGIANGVFVGQTGWGTYRAGLGTGAWGTPAFQYGAGGGCSALFSEPSYQSRSNANACHSRAVPDVSMDADPTTGMLVGETQTFPHNVVKYAEYRIGGTSLASPLLAGIIALADQKALASGHTTIAGANTLFYGLKSGLTDVLAQGSAGTLPDAGNVRHDYVNSVDASKGTLYSVRTFGQDSSLTLGSGWDQTTGLGTVNGGIFAALAAAAPKAR